jgi:uncharacterized membrane protein
MSNCDQSCERYWTAAPKAFEYNHTDQLQEIFCSPTVRRLLNGTKRVFSLVTGQKWKLVSNAIQSTENGELAMSETNAVVAIYDSHSQAEEAVKELQKSGVDMKKLSIVGKDYHTDEQVVGYYNTGDRMKYWGKLGAFWGGIWGMLFGAAFFAIPGIGPILVAGPLVAWIVGALEGAVVVGGLGAVGAGLYSIGIPKDSVVKYETAIKSDKFLVLAHGTANEVAKAKDIMQTTHPAEVALHIVERAQPAAAGTR